MAKATYGALPIQTIRELIESGAITGTDEDCLQPSSLDIKISDEIYRMRGSFLPRPNEKISDLVKHRSIGGRLPPGSVLRGKDTYLCRAETSLKLLKNISGSVSSKSSTGRIDVRCRTLADNVSLYDHIPNGYEGELWVEIVPMSFDIILTAGQRLNQLRLFCGDNREQSRLNLIEHEMAFTKYGLLRSHDGSTFSNEGIITPDGIRMTVDLSSNEIVAYRAKKHWRALDLASKERYAGSEYFEAIWIPPDGELVLMPGEFYLLGTKERLAIPPIYAAEMAQYNPNIGNLFTHFAGFCDPGFGWRKDKSPVPFGNVAVLEVEAHSPTVLRDGQPICMMVFEKMLGEPEMMYGGATSHYGQQDMIKLAKWFDADK